MTPRLTRFDVLAFIGLACALLICALMRRRGHHRAAQVVWCVAILLGSVPFMDAQAHPLWTRVRWVPFWPLTIKDVVVNILLYVPLGFFFKGDRHTVLTVIGFAGLLSLAAEVSQLFSHSRFPATSDVVCNMVGAVGGVVIARATERRTTSPGDALKSAIRRSVA